MPPQPSPAWPQFWPAGQVVAGVHGTPPSGSMPVLPPHWLKPPPPQNWVTGHAPHVMTPPQPSPVMPQLYGPFGAFAHVKGTQLTIGPPSALTPPPHLL